MIKLSQYRCEMSAAARPMAKAADDGLPNEWNSRGISCSARNQWTQRSSAQSARVSHWWTLKGRPFTGNVLSARICYHTFS